ncbi:MAG: DUF2285 domain-containing protein [Rhodospirillales bacterium]|nr:DUF2285 domain-containing protein [Rhodospirillales bacterium]
MLTAVEGPAARRSERQIAGDIHGADADAVVDWDADSDVRAQVRRLVKRARFLMKSGYLELAAGQRAAAHVSYRRRRPRPRPAPGRGTQRGFPLALLSLRPALCLHIAFEHAVDSRLVTPARRRRLRPVRNIVHDFAENVGNVLRAAGIDHRNMHRKQVGSGRYPAPRLPAPNRGVDALADPLLAGSTTALGLSVAGLRLADGSLVLKLEPGGAAVGQEGAVPDEGRESRVRRRGAAAHVSAVSRAMHRARPSIVAVCRQAG